MIHLQRFTPGSYAVEVCPAVHKVLCLHINMGEFLPSVPELGLKSLCLENGIGNSLLKDFPFKDISPPLVPGS